MCSLPSTQLRAQPSSIGTAFGNRLYHDIQSKNTMSWSSDSTSSASMISSSWSSMIMHVRAVAAWAAGAQRSPVPADEARAPATCPQPAVSTVDRGSGRRSSGRRIRALRLGPQRGFTIVGAVDVEVLVANHVPQHLAQLVQAQARYPVRAVTAQTDHAAGRDVGMENRETPSSVRASSEDTTHPSTIRTSCNSRITMLGIRPDARAPCRRTAQVLLRRFSD